MYHEKCELNQIQNDRLIIIFFNIPDIWQTIPDSWIILTYKKTKCVVSGSDNFTEFF